MAMKPITRITGTVLALTMTRSGLDGGCAGGGD